MGKNNQLPPQEQKRNEAYNEYVKQVTPKHNTFLNMVKAFLLGGLICVIGQIIVNVGINRFGLEKEDASTWCSLILILTSVLLTSFNLYPSLANWGGAGALVPITGFANGVCASAIEFKKEGNLIWNILQLDRWAGVLGIKNDEYDIVVWSSESCSFLLHKFLAD